jgi:hypothetical protein
MTTAWEMSKDMFCLVCISNKTELKAVNEKGVVNNNFIWNVSTNELREANFVFDVKYNDYVVDTISIGKYSMFATFEIVEGTSM